MPLKACFDHLYSLEYVIIAWEFTQCNVSASFVLAPNEVVVVWHARWPDRELASQILERKD